MLSKLLSKKIPATWNHSISTTTNQSTKCAFYPSPLWAPRHVKSLITLYPLVVRFKLVPFDTQKIASTLQIPTEEVEGWVIDAVSAKLLEVSSSLSLPFPLHPNSVTGKDEPTKTNSVSRILCAESIHTRTVVLPGYPYEKVANLSPTTFNNRQPNQRGSSIVE
jgi:hypothetical protein